jgi:hypothetical protein
MRKAPSRLASFQLVATLSNLEIDFILAYFKSDFSETWRPRRRGHKRVPPFNSSDYGFLQNSSVVRLDYFYGLYAHVKSGFGSRHRRNENLFFK